VPASSCFLLLPVSTVPYLLLPIPHFLRSNRSWRMLWTRLCSESPHCAASCLVSKLMGPKHRWQSWSGSRPPMSGGCSARGSFDAGACLQLCVC
jgi:hypothetical protein